MRRPSTLWASMPSTKMRTIARPAPTPETGCPTRYLLIGYDQRSSRLNRKRAKKIVTTSGSATSTPVTKRERRNAENGRLLVGVRLAQQVAQGVVEAGAVVSHRVAILAGRRQERPRRSPAAGVEVPPAERRAAQVVFGAVSAPCAQPAASVLAFSSRAHNRRPRSRPWRSSPPSPRSWRTTLRPWRREPAAWRPGLGRRPSRSLRCRRRCSRRSA